MGQDDGPTLIGGLGEEPCLDGYRIQREVVEGRDPTRVGAPGPHTQVTEESHRALVAADYHALVPGGVSSGGNHGNARQDLALPGHSSARPQVTHEAQFWLVVARHEARVILHGDVPFRLLSHEAGSRKRQRPVGSQQSAGVVVVEVAHRDRVHGLRIETGSLESRDDPRPLIATHRPALFTDTIPDSRFHEHAAGRCLDQQAVERLRDAVIVVDLVDNEFAPHHSWDRSQQGACVGTELTRLDQRDADTAAKFGRPVDGVVQGRHRPEASGVELP